MQNILINGNFLARNLTGVERASIEICKELDKLVRKEKNYAILVPQNAKFIPEYKNICIIKSNKKIKRYPFWDMGTFALECKKRNMTALSFSNTAPLGKNCGIAFIHDIYAKDCPKDFVSFRDKLVCLYDVMHLKNITKNAKLIFAVSNFTKNRIIETYNVESEKIKIVGPAWNHFKTIEADNSIFNKFSLLKNKEYYFTLGSLSKRKNLAWIAEYAKKNQNELFAISGKAISGLVPKELEILKELSNVVLLGYVSDAEVKALMQKCKAFIFPSYYEGFGIPPMEALSAGAKIVISDAASLPEIYKESAHYIKPNNTNVNITKLLEEKVSDASEVLNTHTYENSAKNLYSALEAL